MERRGGGLAVRSRNRSRSVLADEVTLFVSLLLLGGVFAAPRAGFLRQAPGVALVAAALDALALLVVLALATLLLVLLAGLMPLALPAAVLALLAGELALLAASLGLYGVAAAD